jgi:hypothetical protein
VTEVHEPRRKAGIYDSACKYFGPLRLMNAEQRNRQRKAGNDELKRRLTCISSYSADIVEMVRLLKELFEITLAFLSLTLSGFCDQAGGWILNRSSRLRVFPCEYFRTKLFPSSKRFMRVGWQQWPLSCGCWPFGPINITSELKNDLVR